MDFNETIRKVNDFYSVYDKTILTVDNLFDVIDTNAGQETSNELEQIITFLKCFWNSHYQNESVNNEVIVDEEFSSFSNRLLGTFENESAIFDLCKEIQTYFRNYTAVDTKPIVHCEADEVISKLFNIVETKQFQDKDLLFAITRIIYELVTDDLLVRCGISKLYKWNYGTDAYSLLSAEQQLIILLNQSIMIDRLHGGQHLLKAYLKRLNKQLDSFKYLDWFVYYVAGFLNFKIHNYRESKKYFEYVEKENVLQKLNAKTRKRYFHAVLLIAYGYEYAGEFSQAIDKIVMPVNDLLALLKAVDVKDIRNIDILLSFLNNLVTRACENTLFSKFFAGSTITTYISDNEDQDQRDIHIEILHALAHCINEYAIQNYSVKPDDCAKLIRLARALMAFIAGEVKEYWTCYATIHGEYKDYDVALHELHKASVQISENKGKIKESLAAELAFYQYYFGQIIHKNIEQERETFSRYCQKYSDDDAFCHLQIFEFRALLRDHVSKMFDFLTKNSRKQSGIENLPSTDTIRKAYNVICQLHPSAHMNINIRTELRLMQRIYSIIDCLNNFLTNPSNYNLKMLENACKRFCYTKKEMGLSEKTSYPECKSKSSVLPEEIHKTLFGDYGVVYCLNVTDSVFLLAPISGVVVYQYQTGTIDKLFDSESLLSVGQIALKPPYSYSQIKDTITTYRKVVSEDKQVQISSADIEMFAINGIENIYLWSSEVPLRLLQANQKGCYSRRLIDGNLFRETIVKVEESAKKDAGICLENDCDCKIHMVNLPWMEVINEDECNNPFLLHSRVRDNTTEYLILSGNCFLLDEQCCEIHRLLERVEVRQVTYKKGDAELPKKVTSVEPETMKGEIIDSYAIFKSVRISLEDKEKYLPKYKGSSNEEEFKLEIEELKNRKMEIITIVASKLKSLSKLLSKDDFKIFVMKEIKPEDFSIFGIVF